MPQNANYAPILPLITTPRLNHFITTFRPIHDCEIYGVYIWTQHAASSIYPGFYAGTPDFSALLQIVGGDKLIIPFC